MYVRTPKIYDEEWDKTNENVLNPVDGNLTWQLERMENKLDCRMY